MTIHLTKILLVGLLLIFTFEVSPVAFGETDNVILIIQMSAPQAEVGSEVTASVFVSAQEPVNAFDIVLTYPRERLEFLRSSAADSIVSVWQSSPSAKTDGVLRLTGGMLQPFSGKDGKIITLIFRAKTSGNARLNAQKAEFALADGKGTAVIASVTNTEGLLAILPEEAPAPRIVEAAVVKDPETKTPIVFARTDNDLRETRVRSREWLLWSEWQKTRLPAALPRYAWTAQVAAIGWEGSESVATIYRWDVAAWKILLVLAVLVVFGYGTKRLFNLWKTKRRKI